MTPLSWPSGRGAAQFAGSALAAVGLLATVLGLIDVLFPDALPKAGLRLAIAVVAAGVVYGAYRARPRPVQNTYRTPSVTIRVVRGDLLQDPAHLVIGMSTTFDTRLGIIAPASLQAGFLRERYAGDVGRLDQELADSLAGVIPAGTIQKEGKTAVYPVGTVAVLNDNARRFFCLAYSDMDAANTARASIDGVWTSLTSLWKAVCTHANGTPVAMPVIGGGQSRLDQVLSPDNAIRLQALSFWLASRQERRCSELRIVVRPEVYDSLDLREIQAFLASLEAA